VSDKEYFGFINIDKPEDWTSHDVVAKLRGILRYKKIGHSGTLDPFATGVLPIALGSATRLIRFLSKNKAYIAELDFSFTTDTDDRTGEKLKDGIPSLTKEELEQKLSMMIGDFEQYPPLYSAKKINGKKLYELMRQGVDLDLSDIKPKVVKIKNIEILDFDFPYAKINVECAEGTYIRSIARDVGAHLTSLRRTKSNDFNLESSVCLDDLENGDIDLGDFILEPKSFLSLPGFNFNKKDVIALQQGQKVYITDIKEFELNLDDTVEQYIQCIDASNGSKELIGLARLIKKGGVFELQPKVIFA
jgi:tRNA pseudouridine55 synthase